MHIPAQRVTTTRPLGIRRHHVPSANSYPAERDTTARPPDICRYPVPSIMRNPAQRDVTARAHSTFAANMSRSAATLRYSATVAPG
ncbi:hypothetical protein DMB37_31540 [Nocardia sp. CS682]|nr:hypothetical protein DMB37_31540 [Nocardia sp. CS682]